MAAEDKEVTIEILDVHGNVGDGLRSVNQDHGARFVSKSGDLVHRVYSAECVRDVDHADQLRAF